MESWSGCNLATIVGNGGPRYSEVDDGEDWFNTTRGVPCMNSAGQTVSGNVRSDNPCKSAISGVFARSSWAARLIDITDGASNTIAMGEIRPYCSVFQWIHGWTLSEGLWFATTAPINFPTCEAEGAVCHDRERSYNTAMGFKSLHTGGANFVFCDNSVRFLADEIDYTTYQRMGARADGEPLGNN
jgi:prepilin-type processing-associated H-X9-DG protein